jgi:hypothetical protein
MTTIDELRRLLDQIDAGKPWTHKQWLRFLRLAHDLHAAQGWQGMGGDKAAMVNPKDGDTW